MTFLAQAETVLNVVDKAAASSDRWLFLAAICVIILGGVAVIRFLVRSIEVKDAAHAAERLALASEVKSERETAKADNRTEREAAKVERLRDQTEFLRMVEALKSEIKLLGESIAKNTETLQRHDTDMRSAHALDIAELVKKQLIHFGVVRVQD